VPKDACYRKVKARYRVFPSAYASGAIAKCRKVGAANYGTGGKKKKAKKKALGGAVTMNNGGAVTRAKRPSSNPNVARGCGVVMSNKRKATKYS
jgi:hypothetical protein|tara:strand:- start:633 stop:914 length:282 start_codon:yes stop_codon:yes gene_type:complete